MQTATAEEMRLRFGSSFWVSAAYTHRPEKGKVRQVYKSPQLTELGGARLPSAGQMFLWLALIRDDREQYSMNLQYNLQG
jgi:hypothetical protein